MGKSAPSPPPPPPDYSAQKSAWATTKGAERQAEADVFNTAVGEFNTKLGGFGTSINTLRDTLGGLSIADLTDTAPDYRGQIDTLRGNIANAAFNTTRPSFSSGAQSPWGSVSVDVPTLNQVNEGLRSGLLADVGGLSSRLDALRQSRNSEERRVRDFRSEQLGNLANLSGQIGRSGIGSQSAIDSLAGGVDRLGSRITSFDSPLSQQLFSADGNVFPTLNDQLAAARTDITGLQGRRDTEKQRIDDFRTAQQSGLDSLRGRFNPLTIANEAGLGTLADDIDAAQLGINRFRSDIATDFNPTLNELLDLESGVRTKQAERESELARISREESGLRGLSRGIGRTADDADIFSLSQLDNLGEDITDAQDRISGFSSLLPFDFSNATERLTGADTTLEGLRTDRTSAIDDLISRSQGIGSSITGLDLQDEEGMREGLTGLGDINAELARFSGGRVGDVTAAIDTAKDTINTRLEDLGTKRGEIETQAQALLESVGATDFTDIQAISDQLDALGLIEEKQQLFSAVQALDEIDKITNRLNSEKQRLETDEEASTAALNRERQEVLAALGPGGVPQFNNFAGSQPLSAREYLALLARKNEEEDIVGQQIPGGFSGNLGVIRV